LPAIKDLRTMLNHEQLFCSKPFKWFEVFQGNEIGEVYLCCPVWLETPIGHLRYQSVKEIWNGEIAQEIRRSILDGSFEYCNRSTCPYLQSITPPVSKVKAIEDKDLEEVITNRLTILPYGPRAINCSYDRSCNLSCPSCRTEVIVEIENRQQIWEIQHKIREEALEEAHLLYMTGSGDPFGSPFLRKFIWTLEREHIPKLEEIFLHTNGLLWTPRIWEKIPTAIQDLIKSTEISIDAAKAETYAVNRRGGSFKKLLQNLQFISILRNQGQLRWVQISMVVQENNFMEMPAFVSLGKRFNFDTVFFGKLLNWGVYTEEEYADRAVHLSSHTRHSEFLNLLKEEIFDDPIVNLGNLTAFLDTQ
jgi:MoaA/NifB/PqqE/SkfB family radical SAM enzyme